MGAEPGRDVSEISALFHPVALDDLQHLMPYLDLKPLERPFCEQFLKESRRYLRGSKD
jgi:hypothetical protein